MAPEIEQNRAVIDLLWSVEEMSSTDHGPHLLGDLSALKTLEALVVMLVLPRMGDPLIDVERLPMRVIHQYDWFRLMRFLTRNPIEISDGSLNWDKNVDGHLKNSVRSTLVLITWILIVRNYCGGDAEKT